MSAKPKSAGVATPASAATGEAEAQLLLEREARQVLDAAQLRFLKRHPYYAPILARLRPVYTFAIDTMAVDKGLRLYLNPLFLRTGGMARDGEAFRLDEKHVAQIEESGLDAALMAEIITTWADPKDVVKIIETGLAHETMHIIRKDFDRSKGLIDSIWNIAADLEINQDIEDETIKPFVMPEWAALPERSAKQLGLHENLPAGKLAEKYYKVLKEHFETCSRMSADADEQDDSSDEGDTDSREGKAGGSGASRGDADGSVHPKSRSKNRADEGDEGDEGDGGGTGDDDTEDSEGGTDGQDGGDDQADSQGDDDADSDGQDDGDADAEADGQDDDDGVGDNSSGQDGSDDSQDGESDGDGLGDGTSGAGDEGGIFESLGDSSRVMSGACGHVACSEGSPSPEMESAAAEQGVSPVSEIELKSALEEVVQEVENMIKSRGEVPGHLQRLIEEHRKPPTVNWRQVFARMLHRSLQEAGRGFRHTYRRKRRNGRVDRPGDPILPGRIGVRQRVAVVVDTSGSMSPADLGTALDEVHGIIKATGSEIAFYSCDAAVHGERQEIRNVKKAVLAGGGGTDMRVGIEAALDEKQAPDVVVVLTDGYTPWPDERPAGRTRYVAGIVRPAGVEDDDYMPLVPDWMRDVPVLVKQG